MLRNNFVKWSDGTWQWSPQVGPFQFRLGHIWDWQIAIWYCRPNNRFATIFNVSFGKIRNRAG
jgi:hypothetical protein